MLNYNSAEREVMYAYLAQLRDYGVTNMFGAVPYLETAFKLDKEEAKDVLQSWMEKDNTQTKAVMPTAAAL